MLQKENLAAQEAKRPAHSESGCAQRQPALGQRAAPRLSSPRRSGEPCLLERRGQLALAIARAGRTLRAARRARTARFIHAMRSIRPACRCSRLRRTRRQPPIGEPSSILSIVSRRDRSVIRSSPKKILPKSGTVTTCWSIVAPGYGLRRPFDRFDDGGVDRAVGSGAAGPAAARGLASTGRLHEQVAARFLHELPDRRQPPAASTACRSAGTAATASVTIRPNPSTAAPSIAVSLPTAIAGFAAGRRTLRDERCADVLHRQLRLVADDSAS